MASPPTGSGGFASKRGHVLGGLERVFDDVWWAWGTTTFMPGVRLPRNMVIVREGNHLVVIHPVLMPPDVQAEVEKLGTIEHIVRLGAFHGMDDLLYQRRYGAKLWAPPGVDLTPGLEKHHDLRPGGELPFRDATAFSFAASRTPETAIVRGDLLLACDAVQNWETTVGCSLLGKGMARAMGFSGRACIGPGWRKMSGPKTATGFASDFARLLELDFRHAIGGHGKPMIDTAKTDLAAQVARLYVNRDAAR